MASALTGRTHFLLDLDGTVYLGERLLPGAAAFIDLVRRRGGRVALLTNNSSRTAADYVAKLARLGVAVGPDEIHTSADATADFLARSGVRRLFLLGTPPLRERFAALGFVLDEEAPEVVLLAFDQTLTYDRLKRACLHIVRGVRYYATHPDRVCPTPDGPIPDCGAMQALIERATGRWPDQVFGKPAPEMAMTALRRIGGDPAHGAMVGDRLYTDIAMGRRAGLATVLVLTGETRRPMVEAAPEAERPDLVVADLAELARLVERTP